MYPIDEEPASRELFPDAEGITVGCFLVDAPEGWEPLLNDEHDEYRWCTFPEALELLYWDDTREALRILAAQLEVAA